MKAKDYLLQFEPIFYPNGKLPKEQPSGDEIFQLFMAFSEEFEVICKERKINSDKAATAVIKELNQKWNALIKLFLAKYKWSPVREDAFINHWERELGGLA